MTELKPKIIVEGRPVIQLVTGSGHTPWHYRDFIQALEEIYDYEVIAPRLPNEDPTATLQTYRQCNSEASKGKKITAAMGHSNGTRSQDEIDAPIHFFYAGTGPEIIGRPLTSRLITFNWVRNPSDYRKALIKIDKDNPSLYSWDKDAIRPLFCAGLPKHKADEYIERLTVQSKLAAADDPTVMPAGRKYSLIPTLDGVIRPITQRMVAYTHLDSMPVPISGGHCVHNERHLMLAQVVDKLISANIERV